MNRSVPWHPGGASPRDSFPELSDEILSEVHERALDFEAAWLAGRRPQIADYLAGDASGGQLLVELAYADLEFRLAAGEHARVEDYLSRFPALGGRAAAVTGLAATELRIRKLREAAFDPAEYRSRFPKLAEDIFAVAEGEDAEEEAARPAHASAAGVSPVLPGFEIVRELGRGGMGVVYEAVEVRLGRRVALKTVRNGAEQSDIERLRREAAAAAAISHPNVARVYAILELSGRVYVASEFISGGTLADRAKGEPLQGADAAALLEPVARAVAAAHAAGVVHRDLKPQNVLLDEHGVPKVTDFGLAKREGDSDLTRTGVIAGSPSYMAPEQVAADRDAGPAADVWSLGAILYELLTGRPPFRGATALETFEQVRRGDPVPPRRLVPRLAKDLETVCLRCLEKDPARRYASAEKLAADLARFRRGEPVLARPIGPAGRAARWAKRNRTTSALLAVVASLVLGATSALAAYAIRLDRLNDRLGATVRDRDAALKAQTEARSRADSSERYARRLLFASDMQAVQQAIRDGDLARAAALLEAHRSESRGPFGFVWNHLDRQIRVPGRRVDTLPGAAYYVRFSPDRKTLAACGEAGEIRLYETGSWRLLDRVAGGQGELNGLAFSPDGTLLASAGDDGTVAVRDAHTLETLRRRKVYDGHAYEAVFGLGGTLLAVCGESGRVELLDGSSLEPIGSLDADDRHVEGIAVTPDGETLLAAGRSNRATAWDLRAAMLRWEYRPTDREIAQMVGHGGLSSVEVSETGGRAAFGIRDARFVIADLATGSARRIEPALTRARPDGPFRRSVAFLPGGEVLAVANDAGAIHLFDLAAPDGLPAVESRAAWWIGASARVSDLAAGRNVVVTAARNGEITAWDPSAEPPVRQFRDPAGDGATGWFASPSGSAGDPSAVVRTRQTPGGHETSLQSSSGATTGELDGHDGVRWGSFRASSGGNRLFAGGPKGEFYGWEIGSRPPRRLFSRMFSPLYPDGELWITVGGATSDGRRVLCSHAAVDGAEAVTLDVLALCDGDTGETLASVRLPRSDASPALAANGRLVACAVGQVVRLLDGRSLGARRELQGHAAKVIAVAMSPDARLVASAGDDREVIVWDAESGEAVCRWQADSGAIYSLDFSPSGEILLTATVNRPPRLWDASTGRPLLEPSFSGAADDSEAYSPAVFSPRGTQIWAGRNQRAILIEGGPLSR